MSDADKKLTEIRERHERDVMWCIPSSIAGPQAHDDRAFLLAEIVRLRADLLEQARLLGMGAEREEKLLARVEVLEAALHAIFPDGANIKLVPKANAEEAKP
jgi:hypothetical protein